MDDNSIQTESPEAVAKMIEGIAYEKAHEKAHMEDLRQQEILRRKTMAFRQARNFVRNFIQTGEVEVKAKGGKDKTKKLPIYSRTFFDKSKYNVNVLRELRHQKTMAAIEGKTHYDDGTPIIKDRLVDLKVVEVKDAA